jgi:hypothetical protein
MVAWQDGERSTKREDKKRTVYHGVHMRRAAMITMKTTVREGRIELKAPDELPDGTEVIIEVTPVQPDKIGIDESEWRDDPETLADWEAWLKTLEPVELTAEERATHDAFAEEFGRHNVEAVRKQMIDGARE